MKELSIEEKASRYDEAIEKAKEMIKAMTNIGGVAKVDDIQYLFPELSESEDERIRKTLIGWVNIEPKESFENGFSKEEILTWLEKQGKNNMGISEATKKKLEDNLNKALEKETPESWNKFLDEQGEQKPTDKVEPKFREGDMIIHKELGGDYIHSPHKIIQVDILDKKYRLEGGLVAHFGEQDDWELVEQKPAWSEEDEHIINLTIHHLSTYERIGSVKKCISWLKSLIDR